MQVKIYGSKEHQKTGPLAHFREMLADLRQAQYLAVRFAIRDIKGMYRQSVLGILWAFIIPAVNTLVWIMLRSSGIVSFEHEGLPYVVYVFSGTMLWAVFTESLLAPLVETTANKSILSKINFPKEGLIIAGFYKLLFNTGIKILLILVMMLAHGIYPNSNIILFPLALMVMIVTGFALGLLLAPVGLLYTDIGKGLPIFMQLFMYLSPVIYLVPPEGTLRTIMTLNPVTPLLSNCRNWLMGLPGEFLPYFIAISMIMFVFLLIGWFFYRLSIPVIVERASQ
ncbi:MAG: ABC transporter permease [Flavobacteriales bacterium]